MVTKTLDKPLVVLKDYKKPISLAEKDVVRQEGIWSIQRDGTKRIYKYKHRRQYTKMSMKRMLKEVAYEEGMNMVEDYTNKLHSFYEIRASYYKLFKEYESVIAEAGLDIKYFDNLFWGKKPYNDNKSRDFRAIYGYTKSYSINNDDDLGKRIGACLFFACGVHNRVINIMSKIKIAKAIIDMSLRRHILYRFTDISNIKLNNQILEKPGYLIYPCPGIGHFYARFINIKKEGINWYASIQHYRKLVEEGATNLTKEDYAIPYATTEIPIIRWRNKKSTFKNKIFYKFRANTSKTPEALELNKIYFSGGTVDRNTLYNVIGKKGVGLYAKVLLASRLDPTFRARLDSASVNRDSSRLDSYIQYMRDRRARREAREAEERESNNII
jgi:hypothetical protein